MEKVELKVEGMTCTNCALTVSKYLEKQGLKDVKVNFAAGDVSFDVPETTSKESIAKGIENLGYTVVKEHHGHDHGEENKSKFLSKPIHKFWFCLPFTLVLMMHMLPFHIHFLEDPWIQLALCLPVYIVGMAYFGKSAINSLRHGVPNMNVLIALGATAAFVYSLIGAVLNLGHNYLYFETAATIITLVFLGNWLEDISLHATQKELERLSKREKLKATMIAFDHEHKEQYFEVENSVLKNGDLILIKSGEQVAIDCKIIWGECEVNEAILTGESMPVKKQQRDILVGGSLLVNGTVKAQVTATGKDTVLSKISTLALQAQSEKPPVQKLADRISAIFVPVVLVIAVLTLAGNYYLGSVSFSEALMRSIAVLVIACPCAMGLATPAAIAVGLGRAARSGILFRDAGSMELFRTIKQVVFDKTGTLTTGKFSIKNWHSDIAEDEFKNLVYSIEKYSNHPIATSVASQWKTKSPVNFKTIDEIKGSGMKASDGEGNTYMVGSAAMAGSATNGNAHSISVLKNNKLIGWIDMEDELRPEAPAVIDYFKKKGIKTFLLSGDTEEKCKALAEKLSIDSYFAAQSPEQKLEVISKLNAEAPTAMVGDGINDAPALAKATIAISINDAAHLAIENANVILMNSGLKHLPLAIGLGKHTYATIKQNLFWAFAYNIVAIPVAALGFLLPGFAALVMGLSDVVLAANSIRLKFKNVL